jgi:hypothetical protein
VSRARWQLIATLLVLALISGALFLKPTETWLDQSGDSFLPKQLSSKLSIYRNYPVFWWNLFVIEGAPGTEPNAAAVAQFCRDLKKERSNELGLIPCSADLTQYQPLLGDWVRDLPRRTVSPSREVATEAVSSAVAKMSLPLGPDLLSVLREDPLQSFRDLQARGMESAKFSMEKYAGFFYDRKTGRTVIPIQMAFPPFEVAKTTAVLETAKRLQPGISAIGPHLANFENETQVKDDVISISIAGTVLLVVVSIFMLYLGQWRLLLFYPFLALSTMASITLTVWWMGKIHGLVLAFGPGIVGLSMDYAVHAAFAAKEKEETWLANAIGLLTTITVVVVGYFSSLPVIQQLMVFSGAGLSIGFVVFYLLDRSEPYLFKAEVFMRRPLALRSLAIATIALAFCAVIGVVFAKPALKLNEIGYESPKTHELQTWMWSDQKMSAPVLTEYRGGLSESADQVAWAQGHQIELKSISQYLPAKDVQEKNLETWRADFCTWRGKVFAPELFGPFLEKVDCESFAPVESASYLHDFFSEKDHSWITIWFPKGDELKQILTKFPDTQSFMQIADLFPKLLAREMFWMAPIVFLLSTVLLVLYYKRTSLVCLAYLPFLTGLGAYFVAYALFDLRISFVTLIGFIMIFGFSLDYGIFAANVEDATSDHGAEVRSALTLTTTMTLAGFIPLLFARHPAMKHLGESLVTGTIGTYFGAVSAVPYLFRKLK